ncbi:hypothetical protein V3C99_001255, partial [Haemonchus contortus]
DVNAIDTALVVPAASLCCQLPVVPLLPSMSQSRNIERSGSQPWNDGGAPVPEGGWEDMDG